MSRSLLVLAGSVLLLASGLMAQTPAPAPAPAPPCSAPEKEQFGFWIGEWDLSWTGPDGKENKGTNKLEWVLGGCVVQENFSTADGSFVGKSWSVYDAGLGRWRQTWVDNSGSYLEFTGDFKDGKMVLSGESFAKGQKNLGRMTFRDIAKDKLEWDWETSTDEGRTWKMAWQIHYVRR